MNTSNIRLDRQGYPYKPLCSIVEDDCGYFTLNSAKHFLTHLKKIHTYDELVKLCSNHRLNIESMGLNSFQHGCELKSICVIVQKRLIKEFGDQINECNLTKQIGAIQL